MENTKFYKIVIFILLFINIGTISFIWINRPPHDGPRPRGGDVTKYLSHELNFSDDQQQQLKELVKENRNEMDALRNTNRELHDSYFGMLANADIDSTKVIAIADSITNLQNKIELLTFYHFRKVRTICNEEQQKKYSTIINDALRMMAPPPPRN